MTQAVEDFWFCCQRPQTTKPSRRAAATARTAVTVSIVANSVLERELIELYAKASMDSSANGA